MPIGPIELLVLRFPGNRFSGEILPELAKLVENGAVRIVDLLFAVKNDAGEVTVLEFSDLDPNVSGALGPAGRGHYPVAQ